MTIRSGFALTAALGLTLAACSKESPVTAPARHLNLAADAANDSGGGRTLLYRSDSLSRIASVSWFDGTLNYYVFVSESQMPGTRTAFLGFGAYDTWYQTMFFGYGTIPAKDVTGSGIGDLRVRTNTAADSGFFVFNAPLGQVDVTWKQVPQTHFKMHFNNSFEWPPLLFVAEGRDQGRTATVSGTFASLAIPDGLQGSMYQSLAHSRVFLLAGN